MVAHTPNLPGEDSLGPLDSRFVDVDALPWKPTPTPGIDMKVLVKDDEIAHAMHVLHRRVGVAAEPSGAVGLAGVLAMRDRLDGAKVGTVVTGGHLTEEQIRTYL